MKSGVGVCIAVGVGLTILSLASRRGNGGGGTWSTTPQVYRGGSGNVYTTTDVSKLSAEALADVKKGTQVKRRTF